MIYLTDEEIQKRLQEVYNTYVASQNQLTPAIPALSEAFRGALMGIVVCAEALGVNIEEVN